GSWKRTSTNVSDPALVANRPAAKTPSASLRLNFRSARRTGGRQDVRRFTAAAKIRNQRGNKTRRVLIVAGTLTLIQHR
ncbi:MAG: hypothetical protein AAFN70_21260, partial [Planctomycetota bacterium]